jgi:hypothetical protein
MEYQVEEGDFDYSDLSSLENNHHPESPWIDDEESTCSESSKIWIPSLFGRNICLKNGWKAMMDQEIQLRIGQANDSLEKLRMALGQKTSLFVNAVRKAKHQGSKSQARTLVNQATFAVEKHASNYRCAHAALTKLGAEKDILEKFKPLTKDDLKVCTDVVEERRVGQRSDEVAWFWRLDGSDLQGNPWLKEGFWFTECPKLTDLIFFEVRRVNWLRAKARHLRWQEELKILESEMGWTLQFYEFSRQTWHERAEWAAKHNLEGHASYAEKQILLWKKMSEACIALWKAEVPGQKGQQHQGH